MRAALAGSAELSGGLVLDGPTRQTVSTLARQAYEAEMATPRTYLESARLFRIGPDEIAMGSLASARDARSLARRFSASNNSLTLT